MSKRFVDKTCVYCGRPSDAGDHIFARAFFLPRNRGNLPKVPACKACNAEKSRLETELATVMLFGGQHADAAEALDTLVPPRLARNQRLHRHINSRKGDVWAKQPSGLVVRGMTLPFPEDALLKLFQFVVRGVHAFHFNAVLTADAAVDVRLLSNAELRAIFRAMLSWNAAKQVQSDLGNKTFEYRGSFGLDNDQISVWEFEMFGGLEIADRNGKAVQRLTLGATAGPRHIEDHADRISRWRRGRGTEPR